MTDRGHAAVVQRFIATGNASCLDELTESFNALYVRGREGYLELNDAIRVLEHLLRILSCGTDEITELGIFLCIQHLTSLSTNEKHCFAVLDKLYAHPARDKLLKYVTHTISTNQDAVVVHHCFEFTAYFLFQNGNRQEVLYHNDRLIKAILPYCSGGLRLQPTPVKCDLLSVLGSMLHLDMAECGRTHSIEWSAEKQALYLAKFLQLGGLHAVVTLAAGVLSTHADPGCADAYGWQLACNVLRNLVCLLCIRQCATAVPIELHVISEADLPILTRALYVRLQEGPHPMQYLITCIGALAMHFCHSMNPKLEEVFFYRGESGSDKTLLRRYLASAALCRDANTEGGALDAVRFTKMHLPHLAESIDAEMQLVVKEDKDRHCANPGCPISGKGLMGAQMMKYGRCLGVYYCSKEHQKEHWSEHKRICKAPEKCHDT